MIKLQTAMPMYQQQPMQKQQIAFKGYDFDSDELKAEKAKLEDFAKEEGTPKFIGKLAKGVATAVGVAITFAATKVCLNKSIDIAKDFIKSKPIQDGVKAATDFAEKYKEPTQKAVDNTFNYVKKEASIVGDKISLGAEKIGAKTSEYAGKINSKISPTKTKVIDFLSTTYNKFMETKFGKSITKFFGSDKMQALKNGAKKVINNVFDFVGKITNKFKSGAQKAYNKTAEKASNIKADDIKKTFVNTASAGAATSIALTEMGVVDKDTKQGSLTETLVNAAAGGV